VQRDVEHVPAAPLEPRGEAAEVVVLLEQADAVSGAPEDVRRGHSAEPAADDVVRALKRHGTGAQIVATSLADPGAFARALGAEGAGVSLAQVVPPLDRVSLPVVAEYRAAYAAEDGQREYSPASLEAFIGAKVLAEAVRRVGPALTREKLLVALEAMSVHDTGGHLVRFSRTSRRGSDRIYLLAIGRDGALLH
jgi:ABC-type branched-subunit amino acid transport system substrate-binding protein